MLQHGRVTREKSRPNMTKFLQCEQNKPTIIYEGNKSAIKMLDGRTKLRTLSERIRWRYNYALQLIAEKRKKSDSKMD